MIRQDNAINTTEIVPDKTLNGSDTYAVVAHRRPSILFVRRKW